MALFVYTITLFVSAFLLFLVQPIVGQKILPKLGGTPSVWNTCVVFFQMALLAGYAYTHTVTTRLSRGTASPAGRPPSRPARLSAKATFSTTWGRSSASATPASSA